MCAEEKRLAQCNLYAVTLRRQYSTSELGSSSIYAAFGFAHSLKVVYCTAFLYMALISAQGKARSMMHCNKGRVNTRLSKATATRAQRREASWLAMAVLNGQITALTG
eukprot:6205960-Pleurochrysis_carterae.AAC.3